MALRFQERYLRVTVATPLKAMVPVNKKLSIIQKGIENKAGGIILLLCENFSTCSCISTSGTVQVSASQQDLAALQEVIPAPKLSRRGRVCLTRDGGSHF